MFSNRIFRNGLLALKTSTACAIPASDMVVLVFSQIFLFAERTTNKIYLLIWICCKGYFNFYNNLPEKKNREEDLNKGEYRYLKCTRPCGFFFSYRHHINLFTTVSIKAYIFNEDMKMRWIQIFFGYKLFDYSLSIGLNIFFHSLVELKNELNFTYTSNLINV